MRMAAAASAASLACSATGAGDVGAMKDGEALQPINTAKTVAEKSPRNLITFCMIVLLNRVRFLADSTLAFSGSSEPANAEARTCSVRTAREMSESHSVRVGRRGRLFKLSWWGAGSRADRLG